MGVCKQSRKTAKRKYLDYESKGQGLESCRAHQNEEAI
jgi:hypothetical protein